MSGENHNAMDVGGAPSAGMQVSETFAGADLARSAETASSAVQAAAVATVQARYIVAQKRPRDWDAVRLALLKAARRPGFAAVARYHKPIGEGVEGPSIRFAEEALRAMGNIAPSITTIYDDREKRIVRVAVTDLESNLCFESDVIIDKTVERSKLKDGQVPIRTRTNSVGKVTYLVEATEDELLAKQGALVSKAMRDHTLRILPSDLKEEAMSTVLETLEKEDESDPQAARKKLVDTFDRIGVKPSDLRNYLGHDLDAVLPAEMAELRAVFATIRDGETTWKDVLEHKLKLNANRAAAEGNATGDKPQSLKDKAKAKAAASAGQPPAEKSPSGPKLVEEATTLVGDVLTSSMGGGG